MNEPAAHITVNDLVGRVKRTLRAAGVGATSADLRVTSVVLSLDVVAERTTGAGFHFRLPVIGLEVGITGKVKSRRGHTLTMALEPPDVGTRPARGVDGVEEVLFEAVKTIRTTISGAETGDDPWLLTRGTVDIYFGATREGTLSIGFDGDRSEELTNKLTIEISRAAPLSP